MGPAVLLCVWLLYFGRRQVSQWLFTERLCEQFFAQDTTEVFVHDSLLLHRTVILQGQD